MSNDLKAGRWWHEGIVLVSGCTPCSTACHHDGRVTCWAMNAEKRFPAISGWNREHTIQSGKQHGAIRIHPDQLDRIRKAKAGQVYAIWNDLFHSDVPADWRVTVMLAMAAASQATFIILTKRPENINSGFSHHIWKCLKHIYLGVTAENQEQWDKRVPELCQNWPGKKIVSAEPLLEDLDILCSDCGGSGVLGQCRDGRMQACEPCSGHEDSRGTGLKCGIQVDGVIAGAETGPGARPSQLDWFRSLRDQCAQAGIPFFFKGWGEWLHESQQQYDPAYLAGDEWPNPFVWPDGSKSYRIGAKAAGRKLDGVEHNDLPWRKI